MMRQFLCLAIIAMAATVHGQSVHQATSDNFLASDDPCATAVVFRDATKRAEWRALKKQLSESDPRYDDANRAIAKVTPVILGRLPPDMLTRRMAIDRVMIESINAPEASDAATALADACLARLRQRPQAEVQVLWEIAQRWQAATALTPQELAERFRRETAGVEQGYGTPAVAAASIRLLVGKLVER